MKCIHKLLLLILIFVSIEIKAQDWQCVYEGVTANFVDTAVITAQHPEQTMWVVNIDSVRVHQGWTYHYGYRSTRLERKTSYMYGYKYCVDPYGASRMSIAMSALGGENFFFNSAGDGVRISTLSHLDQPWICCRINDTTHLYASVTSEAIEPVLGVDDSVKIISFQAKRINGELVAHPLNNMLFKLSKHFGMITLFDFYEFPNYTSDNPVHCLKGISVPGNERGDQNLIYKGIFSFNPGDEFHTYETFGVSVFNAGTEKYVIKVIDLLWNSNMDTVTYRMSRFRDYWCGYDDIPHSYSKDTVFRSYPIYSDNCTGTDNFPEQPIFCNTNGYLLVKYFTQYRSSEYNSRWIKYTGNKYSYGRCSYCADTLVGNTVTPFYRSSEFYIEGCGGPYTYSQSIDEYYPNHGSSSVHDLVYFKKGSEIWGNPFDTTKWVKPNSINEAVKVRLILYPNPSNDLVTLEIPGSDNPDYRLEIFSLSGIKISEMNFTDSKFTFNISDYQTGMYFLKLYKGNSQLGQEKLIKN